MTKATSNVLADNAAGATQLADGAVDTAAILDNAVTVAKLAHGTADKYLGFGVDGAPSELDGPTIAQWSEAVLASPQAYVHVDLPPGYASHEFIAHDVIGGVHEVQVLIQFWDEDAGDWLTSGYHYITHRVRHNGNPSTLNDLIFGDSASYIDTGITVDDVEAVFLSGRVFHASGTTNRTQVQYSAGGRVQAASYSNLKHRLDGYGGENAAHNVTKIRLYKTSSTFNTGTTLMVRGV